MAKQQTPAPEELILAMLRDVLARQAQQMGLTQPPESSPAEISQTTLPVPEALGEPLPLSTSVSAQSTVSRAPAAPAELAKRLNEMESGVEPLSQAELQELADFDELATRPLSPSNMPRILRWLVVGLVAALALVNVPALDGVSLSRVLSDRQALIIQNGLLLKGSGPEVYIIENNQKRWISSLDAFEHYHYKWNDVHLVEDVFLNQFPDGRPLHVLVKCDASPHIYRLENDKKRWIKDIPTFLAEGHIWTDVRFVSCSRLRAIPDGLPIPPDAGAAPQP